ncbi:transketolase [Ruminococcaceae bacterium YRB3002]|nr:transketolase [Ruminococcaceae bacterium YRB3002]
MTEKELSVIATKARMCIINSVFKAQSGHPGGSLSCIDALTKLYFDEMNISPEKPDDPDRDRFVLSKGHSAPALYSILALRGFFPVEDLDNLRSINAHMSGHPDMNHVKGVDMSTGSLGQGISAAVGMAIAAKIQNKTYRTYTVLGDGELAEGQVWEAAMAAAKWKLGNLCALVDVNGLQIDGKTADVMPTSPLDKKFEAFNWNVICADGHDFESLSNALAAARACTDKPSVILLRTVKGRGVSFMEKNAGWHGKAPNEQQYELAINELKAHLAGLEA